MTGSQMHVVADPVTRPMALALPSCAMISLDMAGYITVWPPAAEKMFGYTKNEIFGKNILSLYANDKDEIAELFHDQNRPVMEVRRRKKSGEIFRANLSLEFINDDKNMPIGVSLLLVEIPVQEAELNKPLVAHIIENSDQGILVTDIDERIVFVNAAFTRITGYSAADAIGQTTDLLRSGPQDVALRDEVHSSTQAGYPWQGEVVGRRKNGELFPQSVTLSVSRGEDGKVSHVFAVLADISLHKEAETGLHRLADYDTVTGLPNRSLLDQLVVKALIEAKANDSHGALLVISLNRFAAINDTLGHEVGNELMRMIGQKFRQTLRHEDVLAKVDGDKFIVALSHLEKREHAGIVANKLLGSLAAEFEVSTHSLHVGASVGISVYPDDGMEREILTRYAEVALRKLQQSGNPGFLFYSADMNKRAKENLNIESELRHALAVGQLQLYYQPKVSLRSGRIVGAEALLRWRHPEKGMISPGVFIPVAEETGLIMDIGTWVVEAACMQIQTWQGDNLIMPPVAINLSARQFDRELPHRLQDALDLHQITADKLKLEITESLLMRGADDVMPIMNDLVAMGFALALDDFGTGYSSLAYLKRFPISTLKIDRSFVIGLPHEAHDCAIAQTIVTLAQHLRQEIVAEGVEKPEQMTYLRNLGCDQLQGFLFSPAVPACDFVGMVVSDRRLPLKA